MTVFEFVSVWAIGLVLGFAIGRLEATRSKRAELKEREEFLNKKEEELEKLEAKIQKMRATQSVRQTKRQN